MAPLSTSNETAFEDDRFRARAETIVELDATGETVNSSTSGKGHSCETVMTRPAHSATPNLDERDIDILVTVPVRSVPVELAGPWGPSR